MDWNATMSKLEGLRRRFDRAAGRSKAILLRRMSRHEWCKPEEIARYHELLLFMLAYPDDPRVFRSASSELERLAAAIRGIEREGPARLIKRLADSGMAFTTSRVQFEWETVRALARRFPKDLEMIWREDSAGEALDDCLPQLVARTERDGYLDEKLTAKEWFKTAKGTDRRSDLRWLLETCSRALSGAGPFVADRLFDSFELELRWRLRDRLSSRTFGRFPARPTFYHGIAPRPPGLSRSSRKTAHEATALNSLPASAVVDRPIGKARLLNRRAGRYLLDACLAALCVRSREIDTLSYANEREVWLVRLERGFDLAVFGMVPERRLPIESYFGYVLAKNRLPMGYGGGWVFGDRCEIGVNVFDSFRGGESALAFSNVLRVYRWLFGAKRFRVDPYQIGEGNAEAIQSGAFWFYYRLGFRPGDRTAEELADGEWERVKADRSYRSPARVLRRLAKAEVELQVEKETNSPASVIALGLALTRWIGRRFAGSRERARDWSIARLNRALGASYRVMGRDGPESERAAFLDMSLLAGMIPDLEEWTTVEKRSLAELLRSKGGSREGEYVRRVQKHRRFAAAMREISIGAAVSAGG